MFTISLKPDTSSFPEQIYEVRDSSGKVIGTLTRTSQGYIASDLDIEANPALTLTSLGEVSPSITTRRTLPARTSSKKREYSS